MKTPIKSIASGMMLMAPSITLALGLGDIDVQSKLNEPLRAEIRLLYSDSDEAESTKVSLAGAEDFERVGLSLMQLPMDLSFKLGRGEGGEYVILVTSDTPVTEPYLDFLIEVNWANGRLLREYVVLLDPPVMAPAVGPAITPVAEPPVSEPTPMVADDSVEDVSTPPAMPAPTRPTVSTPSMGDYGPVAAGETLWEISRDNRPSSDVTINQMMVLVQQMNPDAFYEDNINALKRGAILRLPDASDFDRLSQSEAFAEVKTQNATWENYRLSSATRTPTVSDAGMDREFDRGATDRSGGDADSRLEIVPPSGDSSSTYDRPGDTAAMQGEVSNIRAELTRTREELISATLENRELQSRVDDLEAMVDNLERMVTLKDADLADLQAELEMARQGVTDLAADTRTAIEGVEDDSGYDDGYDEAGSATDDAYMTEGDMAADAGMDDVGMQDDGAGEMPEPEAAVTPPPAVVTTPPAQEPGGIMSMLFDPMVLGGAAVVLLLGGGGFWWQRRRKAGASLVDAMMEGDDHSWEASDDEEDVAATVASPNLEESLGDAVQADPSDPQNHLALLRHYYAEGDGNKFAAAADTMLANIGGTDHPAWTEVRAMGTKLAADHPALAAKFAEAAPQEAEPEPEEDLGLDLQGAGMDSDDGGEAPKGLDDDSLDLDFDLDDDEGEAPAPASLDDDLGLDLDFDSDDEEAAPAVAAGEEPEGLDLDLDMDMDSEPEPASAESDDDLSLDMDLDLDEPPAAGSGTDTADELDDLEFDLEPDAAEASAPADAEGDTEFELEAIAEDADEDDLGLGDLDLTMDDDAGPGSEPATADADIDDLDLGDLDLGEETLSGADDEVGTKLDLARAYIEMGDPDGARGMLEEVVADGSEEQKAEAKKLLGDLG